LTNQEWAAGGLPFCKTKTDKMNLKPHITEATQKGLLHLGSGKVDFLAKNKSGNFEHYRLIGVRSLGFGKFEHLIQNVATKQSHWMQTDHVVTKKYEGKNKYQPYGKSN
jgi:hypothetical protein